MAGWSQVSNSNNDTTRELRSQFWWQVIGRVLSTLLDRSLYTDELRDHYDGFFYNEVIPLLGPTADEFSKSDPVSFMCDDNTPVELGWVFKADGDMTVQYAIEPMSPLDGRPISTLHSLNVLEHLAATGRVENFDSSWSRICHETLSHPSNRLPRKLQDISQFFIGIDLARNGMGLKTYHLPEVEAKMTGRTAMELVTSTAEKLKVAVPWRTVTDFINTLPHEYNVAPTIVAVDCVKPSQNRFKVYVRTRATHFSALLDMLTLGGQLQGPAIDATLETVRDIWHGLFGDIDDEESIRQYNSGPAGFLFYYEMAPGRSAPIPKIYIPTGRFCQDDEQVASVMARYVDDEYTRDVQNLFPHRDLTSRAGIHSHITCAAKKGGCQVSSYFNPEAFSQDL